MKRNSQENCWALTIMSVSGLLATRLQLEKLIRFMIDMVLEEVTE